MLRTLSGTIPLVGGGALQSGFIRATPVGATPGAIAPIPRLYIITDGAITAGPIDGGVEYLFEVFDAHLKAVYPDFQTTVTDIADPITWADIYASANTYVPPGTSISDLINAAVAPKANQSTVDELAETVTSDHEGRIAALESSGAFSLEQLQDAVAAMLQGAGDVDVQYDDTAGLITISAANLTTEQVQDIVGTMTQAGANVTVNYDDLGNALTIAATGGGGSGDMLKATYDTDNDGKVNAAQLADEAKAAQAGSSLEAAINARIPASEKGAANGVATLDSDSKIPIAQLPAAVVGGVSYQGTWDAATNIPALASGAGTKGHYYRVATAGTTALDAIAEWKVGDWAIYNGTAWEKVDNTDQVTSVAGKQGAVTLEVADVNGAVGGAADSANDEIAVFSGTTGKLLKRGAYTIAALIDYIVNLFRKTYTPAQYGATAGTQSVLQSSGVRAANFTAIQAAIDAAQANKGKFLWDAWYWYDGELTTNGAPLVMEGLGAHTGGGSTQLSGNFLEHIVSSNGKPLTLRNFTLYGPCEFIPDENGTAGAGEGSTTYDCTLLHIECTSGIHQRLTVKNVHLLGGGYGAKILNHSWVRFTQNEVQHQRVRHVLVNNDADSDSGDSRYEDNTFHAPDTAAPAYSASMVQFEVKACSGLYHRRNKYYGRTAKGFYFSGDNASYVSGAVPQIEHLHEGNMYDSFGTANPSACITYRSAYTGSGSGASAQIGNTVVGIAIRGERSSNGRLLVDIENAYSAFNDVEIDGTVAVGGGGIRTVGVIPNLRVINNKHTNGNLGSFGATKPWESSGTFTNRVARSNTWVGFSSASDVTDEGGGSSSPISQETITISAGAASWTPDATKAGPHHGYTAQDANATLTLIATDGQSGVWKIAQSGVGHTLALAVGGGKTLRWEGGSAPTTPSSAVDDRVDAWVWRCVGNDVISRYVTLGTIAGYTTEGGGGGSTIVKALFAGADNTVLHGTAPDTTNTPGNNWVDTDSSAWKLNGSGGAKDTIGGQSKLNVDASDADVTIEADFILASTDFSLGGVTFNWTDAFNNWKVRFRQSDGLIFVTGLNAGAGTDYYGADYGGVSFVGAISAGTYTLKVVTNGDNVKWYFGPAGGTLTLCGDMTISGRYGKAATKHGLYGPAAGNTSVSVDRFEVLST